MYFRSLIVIYKIDIILHKVLYLYNIFPCKQSSKILLYHTLTWISHGFTCVPPSNPLSRPFLPIPSLWVFSVHQPWAFVSCIHPGLVICFTLDSILVSMLFSQNIPPSPSPTVQNSVLYMCVSFSVLHIWLPLPRQKPLQYCKAISLQLIKINIILKSAKKKILL